MLVEKLDNYDVVLLQETCITNSAGRKERLVAAARKRGFGFWVRSACRGDLIDAMLVHKFSSQYIVALKRENAEHSHSFTSSSKY